MEVERLMDRLTTLCLNSYVLYHSTPQIVAPNHRIHSASITFIWASLEEVRECLFYIMSASEDEYLRIKNQSIVAQP